MVKVAVCRLALQLTDERAAYQPLYPVADPVTHHVLPVGLSAKPNHHDVHAIGEVRNTVDQGPVHVDEDHLWLQHQATARRVNEG